MFEEEFAVSEKSKKTLENLDEEFTKEKEKSAVGQNGATNLDRIIDKSKEKDKQNQGKSREVEGNGTEVHTNFKCYTDNYDLSKKENIQDFVSYCNNADHIMKKENTFYLVSRASREEKKAVYRFLMDKHKSSWGIISKTLKRCNNEVSDYFNKCYEQIITNNNRRVIDVSEIDNGENVNEKRMINEHKTVINQADRSEEAMELSGVGNDNYEKNDQNPRESREANGNGQENEGNYSNEEESADKKKAEVCKNFECYTNEEWLYGGNDGNIEIINEEECYLIKDGNVFYLVFKEYLDDYQTKCFGSAEELKLLEEAFNNAEWLEGSKKYFSGYGNPSSLKEFLRAVCPGDITFKFNFDYDSIMEKFKGKVIYKNENDNIEDQTNSVNQEEDSEEIEVISNCCNLNWTFVEQCYLITCVPGDKYYLVKIDKKIDVIKLSYELFGSPTSKSLIHSYGMCGKRLEANFIGNYLDDRENERQRAARIKKGKGGSGRLNKVKHIAEDRVIDKYDKLKEMNFKGCEFDFYNMHLAYNEDGTLKEENPFENDTAEYEAFEAILNCGCKKIYIIQPESYFNDNLNGCVLIDIGTRIGYTEKEYLLVREFFDNVTDILSITEWKELSKESMRYVKRQICSRDNIRTFTFDISNLCKSLQKISFDNLNCIATAVTKQRGGVNMVYAELLIKLKAESNNEEIKCYIERLLKENIKNYERNLYHNLDKSSKNVRAFINNNERKLVLYDENRKNHKIRKHIRALKPELYKSIDSSNIVYVNGCNDVGVDDGKIRSQILKCLGIKESKEEKKKRKQG